MTIRLSTALRNAMVGTVGFSTALNNGCIEIYSGPQPLTADAPISGTLLGRVTKDGGGWSEGVATNGLQFDPSANGTIAKKAADAWKFTGLAAGTAGWARFRANAADAGGDDSGTMTKSRLDMSIGVAGADLNMPNINITVGAPNTVDVFSFTLPAA
jgi:hypothetical protein